MTQKDRKLIIAEILNRCWDDAAFKAKFVAEPAKILAEAGIPVKAGKTYRVVENTDNVQYIVLPEKGAAAVLEQLKNAAAQKEQFIPAGREVRFVQNSADVNYIILPKKPVDKLSDEELDQVAAGTSGEFPAVTTQNYAMVCPYANAIVVEVATSEVQIVIM